MVQNANKEELEFIEFIKQKFGSFSAIGFYAQVHGLYISFATFTEGEKPFKIYGAFADKCIMRFDDGKKFEFEWLNRSHIDAIYALVCQRSN